MASTPGAAPPTPQSPAGPVATAATSVPATSPAAALTTRLRVLAADIKLSHSVFALPWALLAAVMAWQAAGGGPITIKLVLIVICMIAARTAAMATNRLLDARLDAANPRTAGRALPSGRLSAAFVVVAAAVAAVVFVAAAGAFWPLYGNSWPLALSVPVLAFIASYPLLKRFSRLCHYYLGASLALAPPCAWIAIAGAIAPPPLLMAAAVLLWTAGFDIIYACQDVQVDRDHGLRSVPEGLGIPRALWVSRITHAASVAAMVALGVISPPLASLYFIGVGIAVCLLVIEHAVVSPGDLSRVGLAFFTINGVISLVMGVLGIADVLL